MNNETEIRTMEETGLPEKIEPIAEKDLLKNLLAAAEYKNDPSMQKEIVIQRNGQRLFSFRIRPLSEEDVLACRKKSTKYMPNPANNKLPPVEKEVNYVRIRSWKIYMATIEEDRAKIWDNADMKLKLDIIEGVDAVDVLLTGGEKDAVCDKIDELSNYNIDIDEYAKN